VWQREIGSAKTGYGMGAPPAVSSPDIAPSVSSGAIRFTDKGKNYNIPPNMIPEFQKDHPNAKRQ
jgi:hypothetical protein